MTVSLSVHLFPHIDPYIDILISMKVFTVFTIVCSSDYFNFRMLLLPNTPNFDF